MIKKNKVIIVDDDPVSAEFLRLSLSQKGYDCATILDSTQVIDKARQSPPDLFLLDMRMPKLNGIELCGILKHDPMFMKTPVIFLTAAQDETEKIQAFESGAEDYITKPLHIKEVSARIKVHLEISRMRRDLEMYASQMEHLALERAKQLTHAERLATIGTLSAGIIHEIYNPATFISGNTQTMEKFWDVISKILLDNNPITTDERKKVEFILKEMPALISGIKDGVSRIKKISDNLKGFSHKGAHTKKAFSIDECIDESLTLCHNAVKSSLKINKFIEKSNIMLFGDKQKMEQVFVNIILNASDATQGAKNSELKITAFLNNGGVKITIADNGPGIPDALLDKIWDPFFTTKPPDKGTGLGLPVARSIIEDHKGSIKAFNMPLGGACFEIILPVYKNP